MSEQTTWRTTYQEKLRPTPTQERALEHVLWCCRTLYNTALQQRITAWQRCHVCLTRAQQEAELTDMRAEFPDSAALHRHVLQEVLARLDTTYHTTYHACLRRVQADEQPGFPRFHAKDRYHSFTSKPLALVHLQGGRHRRTAGERRSGAVDDRAQRGALVPPSAGDQQDREREP